jgi:hypothetical protein
MESQPAWNPGRHGDPARMVSHLAWNHTLHGHSRPCCRWLMLGTHGIGLARTRTRAARMNIHPTHAIATKWCNQSYLSHPPVLYGVPRRRFRARAEPGNAQVNISTQLLDSHLYLFSLSVIEILRAKKEGASARSSTQACASLQDYNAKRRPCDSPGSALPPHTSRASTQRRAACDHMATQKQWGSASRNVGHMRRPSREGRRC